jgi:hypothetical protein
MQYIKTVFYMSYIVAMGAGAVLLYSKLAEIFRAAAAVMPKP